MAEAMRIDISQFENYERILADYVGDAEKVINEVLRNEATKLFQDDITRLMPVSGKKKGRHAKGSKSLGAKYSNLVVTIHSKKAFNYLYFPDDGSNTKNHQGNQQFFIGGIEAKMGDVTELIIGRLVDSFNG